MTVKERLLIIQKVSGLTQEKLARRLGVTFAALNRWVNGRAVPRKASEARIDELYRELTGVKEIPATVLAAKKAAVAIRRKLHRNPLREIAGYPDIRDAFILALTYHSNRIEGSTLSEGETAAVLFGNAPLPDKSLAEQLEAKNHKTALEYLFDQIAAGRPLNETLILKLHGILMNSVRSDAGNYRRHAVRILGAYVPTANYLKIPALMKGLMRGMGRKTGDIINSLAATHAEFERIHPFSDGNGRVGRLLMHAMSLRAGLPPVVIREERKRSYLAFLNKAQTKGDASPLEDLICDALLESYDILERK